MKPQLSKTARKITDAEILAVHKALSEAEVPGENRYFMYWKPSWLRHPIKRIKMYIWLWNLRRQTPNEKG